MVSPTLSYNISSIAVAPIISISYSISAYNLYFNNFFKI